MDQTRRPRIRTAVPLTVAAGALLLAGAGGAVAGTMITGAQIKDGTVTRADVKDGTLVGADLAPAARGAYTSLQGYQHRRGSLQIAAGGGENLSLSCPAGRTVLHASAYWNQSNEAVQVVITNDSRGAIAYLVNPSGSEADTGRLELVCALVPGTPNVVIVP